MCVRRWWLLGQSAEWRRVQATARIFMGVTLDEGDDADGTVQEGMMIMG